MKVPVIVYTTALLTAVVPSALNACTVIFPTPSSSVTEPESMLFEFSPKMFFPLVFVAASTFACVSRAVSTFVLLEKSITGLSDSWFTVYVFVSVLTFPARSVAFTVTVSVPSASSVVLISFVNESVVNVSFTSLLFLSFTDISTFEILSLSETSPVSVTFPFTTFV